MKIYDRETKASSLLPPGIQIDHQAVSHCTDLDFVMPWSF
jgi:hypothetical protein